MIWKDVVGYEGLYEVSDTGLVRGKERRVRFLQSTTFEEFFRTIKAADKKITVAVNGYYVVNMHKKGTVKTCYVHDLVTAAFLGEKPEGYCVDHIDANKLNNNLDNLEYVTPSENMLRRYALQREAEEKEAGRVLSYVE